jgi:Coenzyme PQQ synthesis protein D (PqqD)
VWGLLQQPKSICEIRDVIVDEYEVTPEQCERDLLDLLERMKTEGLIELGGSANA